MEPQKDIQRNDQSSLKRFFSEAILIAILTATGYLAAFSYQYSFLRYFGIPLYLVDVNLGLVLFMALSGLIVIACLFMVIEMLIKWNLDRKGRLLSLWIFFCLVFFSPLILSFYNPFHPIVSALVIVILLVLVIVTSVQVYKQQGRIKDTRKGLLDRLHSLYGLSPIMFVMILFFFVGYCGLAGRLVAQYQQNYLVVDTNPPRVIISTYAGSFITIDFSTTTNIIGRNLSLITAEAISKGGIDFTETKLGPLYPANFPSFSWLYSGGVYF